MSDHTTEVTHLEERLRAAFQHVLWLGSRDADTSKWYAEELAKIAVREVRRDIALRTPPGEVTS